MIPTRITVNGCEFFLDIKEMGTSETDHPFNGWWSFTYFGPLPADEESIGNDNDGYIPCVTGSNGLHKYYLVCCAPSKEGAYCDMHDKVGNAIDVSCSPGTEMYSFYKEENEI